jgi:repressor LexA
LAQQNVERAVPVSVQLVRRPFHYFLLRAVGDSMDLAGIHSGDLVLVREQQDAENGQVVVALIDDEATIKEIHKNKDSIVLQPRSTNPANQPIVLHRDFQVQGVVIATIPKIKNSDANDHLT